MRSTKRLDPNAGDILDKVSDYCDYHADEKVIQFCIQYDVLICKKCARDNHGECETIISINTAIKDAKYGSAFTDIETKIEQLNRKISNVSTRHAHDYNYLSTKKDKIKNKISTVRKTINDYLDKIESETEDILNDKMNECKERIEHDKEKIKDIEKRLIKRSDEIKLLKEIDTDYQFLKAAKCWDKSTKNDETNFLAYIHKICYLCNSNTKSLHYFKDDSVHFGVIKLKYEPCCVTLYDANRILVAADNRGFQIIYLDIMSYEHENEFIKTPSGFCWTVSANSERFCANFGKH
ncbi:Hypothetical predicted protein [Mytilus galloprovincialis]|uniref:B box-type domain-containing protein n=1 Tax=Mytilus galloprovincialis TaxID=29158 RepID=A0A8B6EFH4_MYTGA|nr:Hypothetical predicted protein [Mytilus galloprovincialis]